MTLHSRSRPRVTERIMTTMSDFTKVPPVDGFPDEFVRCGKCNAVVTQAESETHKCPESEAEKQARFEQEDLAACYRAISEAKGPTEVLAAIHKLESVERIIWENGLSRAEKQFPPDVLYKLVLQVMQDMVQSLRDMRDREYKLNDELRAAGVPFIERMKRINKRKIEWCDEEESRLVQAMRTFRVRPLREWFNAADLETAKRNGMKFVIRSKLSFNFQGIIYDGKKNTRDGSGRH